MQKRFRTRLSTALDVHGTNGTNVSPVGFCARTHTNEPSAFVLQQERWL